MLNCEINAISVQLMDKAEKKTIILPGHGQFWNRKSIASYHLTTTFSPKEHPLHFARVMMYYQHNTAHT